MKLRFSDGMEFDTSGELRIERRKDGYYVVGKGFLAAVDSVAEGLELIRNIGVTSHQAIVKIKGEQ